MTSNLISAERLVAERIQELEDELKMLRELQKKFLDDINANQGRPISSLIPEEK